jgi:hypothetical protein
MIREAVAKKRAKSVRKARTRTVKDPEATIDFLSKIEIEFQDWAGGGRGSILRRRSA